MGFESTRERANEILLKAMEIIEAGLEKKEPGPLEPNDVEISARALASLAEAIREY